MILLFFQDLDNAKSKDMFGSNTVFKNNVVLYRQLLNTPYNP